MLGSIKLLETIICEKQHAECKRKAALPRQRAWFNPVLKRHVLGTVQKQAQNRQLNATLLVHGLLLVVVAGAWKRRQSASATRASEEG